MSSKPDFQSLRDQWALKAPTPSKERVSMQSQMDRNSNPHNDHACGDRRALRSETEIISDLSYAFADGFLFRQYSEDYLLWLEANGYRTRWGVIRRLPAFEGKYVSSEHFRSH